MRRFLLQYLEAKTSMSGVCVVAEGVQFSNGKCVLTGITDFSVTIYDSIDLIDRHKKTIINWIDKEIAGDNTTASTKGVTIG